MIKCREVLNAFSNFVPQVKIPRKPEPWAIGSDRYFVAEVGTKTSHSNKNVIQVGDEVIQQFASRCNKGEVIVNLSCAVFCEPFWLVHCTFQTEESAIYMQYVRKRKENEHYRTRYYFTA
ncbi:unnamed protein product [Cylicocyclus nassatus]|uniref:Uncharacterized protein n=1 Tax=Cylicocyclus nassatus TaxID=53992 RepID=A0AA36GH30_CYLNA|nr:unnamed protein product [Cylicocyclus nassatus]